MHRSMSTQSRIGMGDTTHFFWCKKIYIFYAIYEPLRFQLIHFPYDTCENMSYIVSSSNRKCFSLAFLGLVHETMVSEICLVMLLWILWCGRIAPWDISCPLGFLAPNRVPCHWHATLLSCYVPWLRLTPSKCVPIGIYLHGCAPDGVVSSYSVSP